jgi:hypothetical protein
MEPQRGCGWKNPLVRIPVIVVGCLAIWVVVVFLCMLLLNRVGAGTKDPPCAEIMSSVCIGFGFLVSLAAISVGGIFLMLIVGIIVLLLETIHTALVQYQFMRNDRDTADAESQRLIELNTTREN